MFTGIIEEVGEVTHINTEADSARFSFRGPRVVEDVQRGDSIAVNGVCLTVTDFTADSFTADVMKVTLDYTAMGTLGVGSQVNLERAMPSDGRFGGHVVQGHVDGTATLLSRTPSENWEIFRFVLDNPQLAAYVVKKGSITINGTSLTVAALADTRNGCEFEVSLIPTTLVDTMLSALQLGGKVNIECDIIAKYVERIHHVTDNYRSLRGDHE